MTMDVEEQKVRFVVAAARREKARSALCEEFGISRPTGYLWWRRYEEAGLAGIRERSRRPKQSPQRTAAELERRVVEIRQRYPDWGARKLQVLLAGEQVEMTRSTVHRILLRHHQVRDPDRHRQAPGRFQRGTPNELWQTDSKVPRAGMRPSAPCRCWTIAAGICRAPGGMHQSWRVGAGTIGIGFHHLWRAASKC